MNNPQPAPEVTTEINDEDSLDIIAVMVFALATLGLGGGSLVSLLNLVGLAI